MTAPADGGRARRVSLSIVDQALSALSNVVITLLAAGALGVEDFGRFGLVYLVGGFMIGGVRSLVGTPVLVRQREALADAGRSPVAAILAVSVACAACIVAAALVVGGDLRAPLLALAVCAPGILIQDLGRLLAFAELRPGRALVLDGIWMAVEVLGAATLIIGGWESPAWFIAVWGGAAWVAAVVVLARHARAVRAPSLRWIGESWVFAWTYLTSFVATIGAYQVTGVALGAVVGVTAVGAVRAAQVLFGPINNLTSGMLVALVPEDGLSVPSRDGRRRLAIGSVVLSSVALALTGFVMVLPDAIGEAVVGDSWANAHDLLLPSGLISALLGSIIGAMVGLRAAKAVGVCLRLELVVAAMVCVGPLSGAALADAEGYLWATVATLVVGSTLWWWSYDRVIRHHERTGVVLSAPVEVPA